jgi:hypothetical protein
MKKIKVKVKVVVVVRTTAKTSVFVWEKTQF